MTRTWGEFLYAPPSARFDEVIRLDRDEAHHLFRVRRVSPGEPVWATDGEGMVYRCIATADRELQIVERLPEFGETASRITLCLGVLRGDALRDAVDVAVQLGAGEIVFFTAAHSEGHMSEERIERLRRVAVAALKQCGRARLPQMSSAASLESALGRLPSGTTVFVAHPFDNDPSVPPVAAGGPLALVVGPEGGLTEREVELALALGCRPLSLGRRRLRSETAVAAGLALLLQLLKECG